MHRRLVRYVKDLPRRTKRLILVAVDLTLIPLALIFAFAAQSEPLNPAETLRLVLPILPYLLALGAGISLWLGIPDIQLKAYERRAVTMTAVFALYLTMGLAVLAWMFRVPIPLGLQVLFAMAFLLFSAASRVVMYQVVLAIYRRDNPGCRVLIYGAGTTGTQLASALRAHETIEPVAFVDDNTALHGVMIAGLPVYTPAQIGKLAEEKRIKRVLLAIPSLSQPKQARIARRLQDMGLEVQTLPSFSQLIGEEPILEKLTPVKAANFLARPAVDDRLSNARDAYRGRSVLISGAGGSIGQELSRQVLAFRPRRLVLYELTEFNLWQIEMELRPLAEGTGVEIVPILGSVTDPRQVRRVLAENAVEVVLHAAAYKHVPLVEANPLAGLANNVLGTQTLAKAAHEAGVERFILVSSDKAVRPTSVMGASKRLAELVLLDLSQRSRTIYSMVRFGNVLGSSGSVVPLFQEQVSRGGPVTVTHPEVKRFFMTTREAVHLVLRAGTMSKGGEVFVLDMGEPVSIRQLAISVIERAGYTVKDAQTPDGDIEILYTGLRPGEKLVEELTYGTEHVRTGHPKIFSAREPHLSEIEVAGALRGVRAAVAAGDVQAAHAVIDRFVETGGAAARANL